MNLLFFYLFSIFIAYVFLFLSIFYSFFAKSYIFYYDNVGPPYSRTTLIRSSMGQENFAVLTGDHINDGFYTRKCMAVLPGGQKKWP